MPVAFFGQTRDAKRAIKRTERVATSLAGLLVDDWIKTMPLLSGKPYEVIPVAKQDGANEETE